MEKLVSIQLKTRGDSRVRIKLGKIQKLLPKELNRTALQSIERMKIIAQREITKNTKGSGDLAASIMVKTLKKQTEKGGSFSYQLYVKYPGNQYAEAVHDGFTPHWVKISTHEGLENWIEKNMGLDALNHLRAHDRIFVGGQNAAPWIKKGGIKFFDIAFRKELAMSKREFNNAVKRIIKY